MISRDPVTVTLPRTLLRRLDSLGRQRGLSRSRLVESLLLSGERALQATSLQEDLSAYYGAPEDAADRALAAALAGAARLVPADELALRRHRKAAPRRKAPSRRQAAQRPGSLR